MSGIRVIPRFRPLNKRELSEAGGDQVVVKFDPDGKALSINDPQTNKPINFTFDHVLQPEVTQEEAFKYTAEPMIPDIFAGYNATVFTYGQTGSGKSHTMMGNMHDEEQKGIIPRLVEGIFKGIANAASSIEFTVKVSYVEIYNEKIRDLKCITKDNLKIRENNGNVWIEDVTQVYVTSVEDVYKVMDEGGKNRAVSSTKMNAESSRSHSVFIMTVGQKDTETGSVVGSQLTLIDLAGSEKVGKTEAAGQTLKEAQSINKSLSALGNVINALTTPPKVDPKTGKKAPHHVPFRSSKLTFLLQTALGGSSKATLICALSPSSFNNAESLSTLRFGSRAKSIKNKPKINQEKSSAEYQRLLNIASTKIKLLQESSSLMEAEVMILRRLVAQLDPISILFNSAQAIEMIVSQTVRSSIGKISKKEGGHPKWQEYIIEGDTSDDLGISSLSLDTDDASGDLEASEDFANGETIDDFLPATPLTPSFPGSKSLQIPPPQLPSLSEGANGDDGDGDDSFTHEDQDGEEKLDNSFADDQTSTISFNEVPNVVEIAGEIVDDDDEVNENDNSDDDSLPERDLRRVSTLTNFKNNKKMIQVNAEQEEEINTLKDKIDYLNAYISNNERIYEDKIAELTNALEKATNSHTSQVLSLEEEHSRRQLEMTTQHQMAESLWNEKIMLEKQKYNTTMNELNYKMDILMGEKEDLEKLSSSTKRELKQAEEDLIQLQEEKDSINRKFKDQEMWISSIKSKHGDDALDSLTSEGSVMIDQELIKQKDAELDAITIDMKRLDAQCKKLRGVNMHIIAALQQKSEEHSKLHLTLNACKVHIQMLEDTLMKTEERTRVLEQQYSQEVTILNNKIKVAEALVADVYDSAKHWANNNRYRTLSKHTPAKGGKIVNPNNAVVVPTISGGGRPVVPKRNSVVKPKVQSSMQAFF